MSFGMVGWLIDTNVVGENFGAIPLQTLSTANTYLGVA